MSQVPMSQDQNPIIKPCRENYLKTSVRYPSWVIEKETESEKDPDSDSEFQTLFKMIQMNEYTASDDVGKSDSEPKSTEPRSRVINIPQANSIRTRTPIVRPTLFMKSTGNDRSKTSQQKRMSTSVSLSGAGSIAALRILFLQNALAENVEPVYRKKDRVFLQITQADFNRCHKSESKKIADRVRGILNRNFIYINDRDIAEDLELKLEKLIRSQDDKKSKQMEDLWKQKDPFLDRSNVASDKGLINEGNLSLIQRLNYNMPHRNFDTDITKYVKRLRELADFLNLKPPQKSYEEIYSNEVNVEIEKRQRKVTKYLLIPTEKTYLTKKKHPKEKSQNTQSISEKPDDNYLSSEENNYLNR